MNAELKLVKEFRKKRALMQKELDEVTFICGSIQPIVCLIMIVGKQPIVRLKFLFKQYPALISLLKKVYHLDHHILIWQLKEAMRAAWCHKTLKLSC